ncbi:MAG: NAD(P)H-dependent oxidoreductase subunit E [Candidatus Baltobacteraceae bacterium]
MSEFTALYERLKPKCLELIAEYEQSRSALLPIIHLFQAEEGYASKEAMAACAELLNLPQAVVESTVSFYTLFFRRPIGKYMLQVCRGLSCAINGAEDIHAYFREQLGIGHFQTTHDGLFSYEEVECLAACDRATCMQVNLEFVYDLTPKMIDDMLVAMRAGTYEVAPLPQTATPGATWAIEQGSQVSTGTKSAGAQDVSNPNNAGGVADKSGVIMIDRILAEDSRFRGRTQERVVYQDPSRFEKVIQE